MKTIISQKLLNVLKNKIIPIISLKLFNDVEFLLNNLFVNDGSNHYFSLIYKIQTSAREMVKSIVSSTFEELDNDFKESTYRKTRYFVNKSNVSRTLITIVGEITFKRTYYVSQNNSVKFYLCEFHFKQAIHHITTDADERYYLIHIFKISLNLILLMLLVQSYIIIQIVKRLLPKSLITLLIIIPI